MLNLVISGGQTGADQAGLHAARRAGLATGGTAPRLWLTEDGPAPWLADFGLVECDQPAGNPPARLESAAGRRWVASVWPPRTLANAAAADATIIFGNLDSAGSKLTSRCCRQAGKLLRAVIGEDRFPPAEVLALLLRVDSLNVAGNRESSQPGIGEWTGRWLDRAFTLLRQGVPFLPGDEVVTSFIRAEDSRVRVVAEVYSAPVESRTPWYVRTECGVAIDASWFLPAGDAHRQGGKGL